LRTVKSSIPCGGRGGRRWRDAEAVPAERAGRSRRESAANNGDPRPNPGTHQTPRAVAVGSLALCRWPGCRRRTMAEARLNRPHGREQVADHQLQGSSGQGQASGALRHIPRTAIGFKPTVPSAFASRNGCHPDPRYRTGMAITVCGGDDRMRRSGGSSDRDHWSRLGGGVRGRRQVGEVVVDLGDDSDGPPGAVHGNHGSGAAAICAECHAYCAGVVDGAAPTLRASLVRSWMTSASYPTPAANTATLDRSSLAHGDKPRGEGALARRRPAAATNGDDR
jgi:hypothetical protein